MSGEVNKARHMPQSHNLIATKTVTGEVHLWDLFRHPSKPEQAKPEGLGPNLLLLGHEKEGYGLSWNPTKSGLLASGSDDGRVLVWDVNGDCSLGKPEM